METKFEIVFEINDKNGKSITSKWIEVEDEDEAESWALDYSNYLSENGQFAEILEINPR